MYNGRTQQNVSDTKTETTDQRKRPLLYKRQDTHRTRWRIASRRRYLRYAATGMHREMGRIYPGAREGKTKCGRYLSNNRSGVSKAGIPPCHSGKRDYGGRRRPCRTAVCGGNIVSDHRAAGRRAGVRGDPGCTGYRTPRLLSG